MAATNKAAVQKQSEETPLLREWSREASGDDGSEETLAENGDEEELLNPDRANQHVGSGRGFLIIVSVWGLIFLQGNIKLPSENEICFGRGIGLIVQCSFEYVWDYYNAIENCGGFGCFF